MEPILTVDHVSINYKIGDFRDIGLKEWTMRHLQNNYHVETFLAVDDVSFALEKGDMLGIIGTNGAGKSTLLKAITGVMEPRSGVIRRNGNVVALLELASGFDGDLTVKENAYLRGAMLGYTREFMDKTYQEILDFSELWEYEDRPFKQLSTGMKSRLAFSIASMVQPEILVLDEVLSVGDGAFQEKSAKKMRDIIRGGAATILVSHSLNQIRELCNKVLWLDHGRQIAFGDSADLCDAYEVFLNSGSKTPAYKMPQSGEKKKLMPESKLDKTNIDAGVDKAGKSVNATDKSSVSIDELLSNKEFLSKLRFALSQHPCIWGDKARLNIHPTVILNDALLNTNCGTITIGEFSFTGHGVSILTGTHYMERKGEKRRAFPRDGRDILIGKGVWLASGCMILGPCSIGDHAVVAAGAVVTPGTVIPSGTIWGGNPAKQLRKLDFENES